MAAFQLIAPGRQPRPYQVSKRVVGQCLSVTRATGHSPSGDLHRQRPNPDSGLTICLPLAGCGKLNTEAARLLTRVAPLVLVDDTLALKGGTK